MSSKALETGTHQGLFADGGRIYKESGVKDGLYFTILRTSFFIIFSLGAA